MLRDFHTLRLPPCVEDLSKPSGSGFQIWWLGHRRAEAHRAVPGAEVPCVLEMCGKEGQPAAGECL